jgi:ubiquinone/menaquinone biosynthesis C-methylase UbiE
MFTPGCAPPRRVTNGASDFFRESDEHLSSVMSVARHLNIPLEEYDSRIRTFIPGYEQMIEAAARCLLALDRPAQIIVDVGIGTGALAARAVQLTGTCAVTGIDVDGDILELARERLAAAGAAASFLQGSFLDVPLPQCDALVASLALHHVTPLERKQDLYARIAHALREGGLFVTADCFPSSDPLLAKTEHDAWRGHLRATYSEEETDGYFTAWALEDTYVPLEDELMMIRRAGLAPEVVWRLAPMAVIAARKACAPVSHSLRGATIGSTREARRAGMRAAPSTTIVTPPMARPKESGSAGLTPNSVVCSVRVSV